MNEIVRAGTHLYVVALVAANFIVLRRMAPVSRSFARYCKLCCIFGAVALFALSLIPALAVVVLTLSSFGLVAIDSCAWLLLPAALAYAYVLVVYHLRVQSQFWGLSAGEVGASLFPVCIAICALTLAVAVACTAVIDVASPLAAEPASSPLLIKTPR
jgi:hypothetical protein